MIRPQYIKKAVNLKICLTLPILHLILSMIKTRIKLILKVMV